MIRRLFIPLATAAGVALCAVAAAPAIAKDKPAAAEGAAGDAKADRKKPGKAEAKPAPGGSKPADAKPSEAKKSDAKKPAESKKTESKKTAEAKKGDVRKPDAEEGEGGAGGKDARNPKGKSIKDVKPGKEKPAEKEKGAPAAKAPVAVGSFGDWNAMSAHGGGKDKTCYALAEPKERQPAKLQRDKAYVFISTRPGEGVRNEVAIILGFPLKDGGAATAEIDGSSFELVTKGTNAWVKNPAKEKDFVDALRNGSKLVIKAPSIKGNVTTDIYSLKGLSEALARVQKECQ